jgi:hypothetical protein
MVYSKGTCDISQLRHRMMSRGIRSAVGTAARNALTTLVTAGIMVGVGVVDWESGNAMTLYIDGDGTVTWYYHKGQVADVAADYRERGHIRRVTHYPARPALGTERLILTDGVC